LVGVPEDELRRFEAALGHQLPIGYRRFLSQVGVAGALALADGSAMFWPDPQHFAEVIDEMASVPFSYGCTPVLIQQGYYVQWIDDETGAVFGWVESDDSTDVVWLARSFADWLRRYLEG
jgi:hypothetical protein